MRIVIAGGSGFLGLPLAEACRADGHTVTVLTRATTSSPDTVHWVPNGHAGPWAAALHQTDAVINLAGASIAGARWTTRRKALLRESRLLATRSLIDAIAQQPHPPAVFISGSAVGYYGPRGDDPVTEDTPKGTDFLAGLAAEWEDAAQPAARLGVRLVVLRTGLALAPDGGLLGRMLPPFRLGAGGRLGSGRQFVPWIHRRDWIDLVRWALATPSVAERPESLRARTRHQRHLRLNARAAAASAVRGARAGIRAPARTRRIGGGPADGTAGAARTRAGRRLSFSVALAGTGAARPAAATGRQPVTVDSHRQSTRTRRSSRDAATVR